MITYRRGNLLATPDNLIVHGCNAQGVMGSGVAKAIREKYPKAFEEYAAFFQHHSKPPLGYIIVSKQPDGKEIINAITQPFYGKANIRYVSYDAIDIAMHSISQVYPAQAISMPKIGAGLGNGHWPIIEQIIAYRLAEFDVTIYEL